MGCTCFGTGCECSQTEPVRGLHGWSEGQHMAGVGSQFAIFVARGICQASLVFLSYIPASAQSTSKQEVLECSLLCSQVGPRNNSLDKVSSS